MEQKYQENFDSPILLGGEAQKASLASRARILRAPLFKSESSTSGTPFRVASVKDFPAAGYLPRPARQIRLVHEADRALKFVLKPWDLLVVTVGSIGNVTVVPADCEDDWIPATNMYVVRFTEGSGEMSRAAYAMFKSPTGQALLTNLARGRGIKIVPKKIFSRIELPIPDDSLIAITEQLWEQEHFLYQESLRNLAEARAVYKAVRVPDLVNETE